MEDLSDKIIAIAEKMGDTIEIDGIVKLKVPANKILAEELQIPESSLGDKLRSMEAKNILTLKPWSGGSKRGRYLES